MPRIPAYYINLDRAVGRRDWMDGQAQRLGVDLVRFPAVEASTFADRYAAELRAPRAWKKPLSDAELACALSHRTLWQRAADSGSAWTAIFEDDVALATDAGRFLQSDAWLPEDADIVKLETFHKRVLLLPPRTPAGSGRSLMRLGSSHVGGAGYILSRSAAQRLVAAADRWAAPVDQVLFNPECMIVPGLTILQVVPALCIQQIRSASRFLPDTAEGSSLRTGKRRSALSAVVTEATRPARQLAQFLQMKGKAVRTGGRWEKVHFAPASDR